MEIKPMNDRVLIAQNAKQTTTESGIILEGSRGTGEIVRATVLAVGPDVKEVSVGEVVLLDWNKTVKTGDHFVVTEDNIVFVYEE